MMDITVDSAARCANVLLVERPSAGEFRELSPTVFAYVDEGAITALEIIDTTQFGDPFDEAAAERAVAWAREHLAGRTVG